MCRLLASTSSWRAACAQLPWCVAKVLRMVWRWQSSTALRRVVALALVLGAAGAVLAAALGIGKASKSSQCAGSVTMALGATPWLRALRAARLMTCYSSRTLPGQW